MNLSGSIQDLWLPGANCQPIGAPDVLHDRICWAGHTGQPGIGEEWLLVDLYHESSLDGTDLQFPDTV